MTPLRSMGLRRALVIASLLSLLIAGGAWWIVSADRVDDEDLDVSTAPARADPALVARGRYLAQAGHCAGCHTARGGASYAGGRPIATPFGTVHSSNLTPDAATGLGLWTANDFWRALHHGRSRDGRLLYPAFPYPNYSLVTRADADALFAYLRSLAPVAQPQRAHALRFPFDTQAALAAWRALYFDPQRFEPDAQRSAAWNRGAYLVRGLGHCSACHASRNALGAAADALALDGGTMPAPPWYAPSLASPHEAGLAGADAGEALRLLRSGVSAQASVSGPMAEVVRGSLQHLDEADLQAMVVYLQSLAPPPAARRPTASPALASAHGLDLYEKHCAACHGERGEGALGIYPPLAGSRALLADPPANAVLAVLGGGFPPATAGNPRPYGMPPFATLLDDAEIATLLTTLRASFGNAGSTVSALEVGRYRGSAGP